MRLSDHLDPERIKIPLIGTTKEEILNELVELAVPDLSKRDEAMAALRKREAIQSTGIGQAVAIPHCILPVSGEIVLAAGVHPKGVDFGSSDKAPAKLFVMVISSSKGRNLHLRMLTCISHLFGSEECRNNLMNCPDSASYLRLIQNEEDRVQG